MTKTPVPDIITVRHINAETDPLVALKHADAFREGAFIRVCLHVQNTRRDRAWYCPTREAARSTWGEALNALGYGADQGRMGLIEPLLTDVFGPEEG